MDIEKFRDFCLSQPNVTESTPFNDVTLVFKVEGKMFAFVGTDDFDRGIVMKCAPDYAEELREKYPEITPGYHMNKRHWNTISPCGDLSDKMILDLTRHAYECVLAKLSKKKAAH